MLSSPRELPRSRFTPAVHARRREGLGTARPLYRSSSEHDRRERCAIARRRLYRTALALLRRLALRSPRSSSHGLRGAIAQPAPYRDARLPTDAARARPVRPHDARGEVLAAVHDPGRPRRPDARLLARRVRAADRARRRATRRAPARHARTPSASTPSSATSSSARGSASRSFRSRKRCTASCATARPCSRRPSRSPPPGTRRSMARVARAIARETRSRGIRQVLSPVVNIANDVRWGRVEETYGEDPFLTSVDGRARSSRRSSARASSPRRSTSSRTSARAAATAIRSTSATACSRSCTSRRSTPRSRRRRALGDDGVQLGGRLAGDPEPRLLNGMLKGDWGFSGFVISDAAATGGATVLHHTEASTATAAKHALESGLDVIFQSSWPQHRPYLDAFRRGLIADSVIDAAVARVLRAKFELGLFERPYVDADSAAYWNGHARPSRARARGGARVDRAAEERAGRCRSRARVAIDRRDRRRRRRRRGSAATADRASRRSRSSTASARSSVAPARVRYAPGPGRATREYVVVPAAQLSSVDRRTRDARAARRVLRQQPARGRAAR